MYFLILPVCTVTTFVKVMYKHRITVLRGNSNPHSHTKINQFSSEFYCFKIYVQGIVTLIRKAAISQVKYKYLLFCSDKSVVLDLFKDYLSTVGLIYMLASSWHVRKGNKVEVTELCLL